MSRKRVALASLFLAGALSSCAGGLNLTPPQGAAGLSPDSISTAGKASKTYATMTISIPFAAVDSHERHHRRYVSPATQSIEISVTSASASRTFAADLFPARNKACKAVLGVITCVLKLRLTSGRYMAAISTYDGPIVHGEPSGNELSANQALPFKVRANSTNPIKLSLGGAPQSIAFVPAATSQLAGNVTSGFTLPRCEPSAQRVSAFGVDADGNFILGAGAPVVTMRSGSTSLTVVTPRSGAPNLFVLNPPVPPSYPIPGSTVYIEVLASPTASSGARPAFGIVKVSFSTDICGVFTEFPVPTASSSPLGIAVGSDGAIWFTELKASKIGRIPLTATAANPQVTEYSTPTTNSGPEEIAAGPDGALWFTECIAGSVGRIPTSGASIVEYRVPSFGTPRGIAAGPDGAMWFAELNGNKIGRIPTSGLVSVTEYPVPTASSHPSGIVAGSDGAMWFTEASGNNIGRIPTSGAPISELPIGTPNSSPRAIAAGPDGALWFTECHGEHVGRAPVAGSGVQEFSSSTFATGLYGITTGADGALWFAEADAGQIGRLTTTGALTQYNVPTVGSKPRFIVSAPDGSLWFTEFGSNKIGRLQ